MLLRRQVIEAFKEAIRASDPRAITRQHVRLQDGKLIAGPTKLDLSHYDRVFVIGGGKASLGMALEIERILGDRVTDGIVNIPNYLTRRPGSNRVKLNPAAHPIPSMKGVIGVEEMLRLVGRRGDAQTDARPEASPRRPVFALGPPHLGKDLMQR